MGTGHAGSALTGKQRPLTGKGSTVLADVPTPSATQTCASKCTRKGGCGNIKYRPSPELLKACPRGGRMGQDYLLREEGLTSDLLNAVLLRSPPLRNASHRERTEARQSGDSPCLSQSQGDHWKMH